MALTNLMMDYVSLTNQLEREEEEVQQKQIIHKLNKLQEEIEETIKRRKAE